MCHALAKRNKQKPFDYHYAENFSLEGETDAMLNNSYYFSAHDEKMSVFARLGKRVHSEETWFAVYTDGKIYTLQQEYFPVGASPIHVGKNGENWTVTYQGKLNETDEACLHATFVGKQKPIDFTSGYAGRKNGYRNRQREMEQIVFRPAAKRQRTMPL